MEAGADLLEYDLLIVGKGGLTVDGPAPDIAGVRVGLKVLFFEQTSDALEKRLGFRVAEYGLRRIFKRVPDHPLPAGIMGEHLRDWRGEATILPPRLRYEMRPRHGPTVQWCGIPVTRVRRCGNRGNVASILSALYGAAGVAHHPGLTRLLLEWGADPNDGEVAYHTPEGYDNGALKVLVMSGRLNGDSSATMLLRKHDWHDHDGLKWLLEQGADPVSLAVNDSLLEITRDRGYSEMEKLLEATRGFCNKL